MNAVVDRIMNTYQLMRPLDPDQVARLLPPATGPMSVQPVEHGSKTTAAHAQPMLTRTSNPAQKSQSPRAEAVRTAKAKMSRRKSLKKQQEDQKVSGDRLHSDEDR
jgi:hypothetical protein